MRLDFSCNTTKAALCWWEASNRHLAAAEFRLIMPTCLAGDVAAVKAHLELSPHCLQQYNDQWYRSFRCKRAGWQKGPHQPWQEWRCTPSQTQLQLVCPPACMQCLSPSLSESPSLERERRTISDVTKSRCSCVCELASALRCALSSSFTTILYAERSATAMVAASCSRPSVGRLTARSTAFTNAASWPHEELMASSVKRASVHRGLLQAAQTCTQV